jgi:hypothetical protein
VKSDKNCLLFQVEESEKSSKMVVVGWYRRWRNGEWIFHILDFKFGSSHLSEF